MIGIGPGCLVRRASACLLPSSKDLITLNLKTTSSLRTAPTAALSRYISMAFFPLSSKVSIASLAAFLLLDVSLHLFNLQHEKC
jgi:hypothetical protein